MKMLAVLLISVSAVISGCADFGAAYRDPDHEQVKQQQPVDRNRNSVPDTLERKAVPMEPVIDRPLKSPD
jgi:hypothetical protein